VNGLRAEGCQEPQPHRSVSYSANRWNNTMADPTLRPAVPEDFDFLYDLRRATMKDYVVQTWGKWDEEWQRSHFREHFNPAVCRIITFQGQDVGVLSLVEREGEVFLGNIEVSPDYQGKGIGTFVIRSVLKEAHRKGKPVALQVLKVNPARRLYERLGFSVAGETATHYLMKATPTT